MDSPVIELLDVVALLGNFPALAGVDMTVAAGDVVLLQGPNGAGKTTLLRLCAGLIPVHSGQATVLGVDLAQHRSSVRPLIGLLGHATMLYDDLSVAENVSFWGRLAGVGDDQVGQSLARMGIEDLQDRKVRVLSAGQRRRTSIAATVIRRPQLWLLDEPHASLDAEGRDVVDSLISDAVASGATVLIASHEHDRVAPLATRTITIAGGTAWPELKASHV